MSELKPCPLCGSEVGWVSGSIRCSKCGLSYGAPVSKEKVERRWNTRAVESASGLVYIPSFRDNGEFPEHVWASQNGETVAYFRERTCHQVNIGGYSFRFECSACGYVAIVHNCAVRLDELPNWCPNCGARVERGDA